MHIHTWMDMLYTHPGNFCLRTSGCVDNTDAGKDKSGGQKEKNENQQRVRMELACLESTCPLSTITTGMSQSDERSRDSEDCISMR